MTKFLADENIPLKTVTELKEKGIDPISIIEIYLGLSDMKVVDLTNEQERIVITFDNNLCRFVFWKN